MKKTYVADSWLAEGRRAVCWNRDLQGVVHLRDPGVVLLRVEDLQDLVEEVLDLLVAAEVAWDLADLEVEHDLGAEIKNVSELRIDLEWD